MYHLNEETQRIGLCRAEGACDWRHFPTREEAEEALAEEKVEVLKLREEMPPLTPGEAVARREELAQQVEEARAHLKAARLRGVKLLGMKDLEEAGERLLEARQRVLLAEKLLQEEKDLQRIFLKVYRKPLLEAARAEKARQQAEERRRWQAFRIEQDSRAASCSAPRTYSSC